MTSAQLYDCLFATWSPTIGDPSVMGWLTVVAYGAAFLLAVAASLGASARQKRFWIVLAVILLALMINKQLDLQSALTAIGRCVAKAQGWYGTRGKVQLAFIFAVGGLCLVLTAVFVRLMRKDFRHVWLALLGFAFLLAFVAIRAAGFHHFDRFIGAQIGSVRMNWLLELGGIAMIAVNAAHAVLRRRQ